MKNYSKEQFVVIILSVIILVATAILVASINPRVDNKIGNSKYRKSIDSVSTLDMSILHFKNRELKAGRDIHNFKIKKKVVKKKVFKKKIAKKVVKTTWVVVDVDPYPKEKLTMVMSINDKVSMSVNGKMIKYGMGDKVPVGLMVEKEQVQATKAFTGKKRITDREYEGRIILILKRSVYVSSYNKKKAFKIKPSLGPVEIPISLVPSAKGGKEESDSNKGKKRRI